MNLEGCVVLFVSLWKEPSVEYLPIPSMLFFGFPGSCYFLKFYYLVSWDLSLSLLTHLCALKFFSVSINHILMIFIQDLYPSITFSGSWVKVFLSEGIGKSVRMYFFYPDLDCYWWQCQGGLIYHREWWWHSFLPPFLGCVCTTCLRCASCTPYRFSSVCRLQHCSSGVCFLFSPPLGSCETIHSIVSC